MQAAPPRRLRRRWLALAALPVILAGVTAVGSVGVAVAYESTKSALPVTPADRALVFEADALAPELAPRRGAGGTLEKFAYFDGSWELCYSFEDDALLLVSTVACEGSPREAEVGLRAAWGGLRAGTELLGGEAALVPVEGFEAGDARRLGRIEVDGAPVGSAAAVRVGRYVVTVVLQGRWFVDAAEAEAALAPSLDALRALSDAEAAAE
ncbi:MAG: hypothetical protein R3F62_03085 [Planctomycetota bacterium]